MSNDNLPPLPDPAAPKGIYYSCSSGSPENYWNADQVRQCQRDAVAAASGAGVPELRKAFITSENIGREGLALVLKFNKLEDCNAVHDFLIKCQKALAAAPTPDSDGGAVESAYNELIFAVGMKHQGETRHQTALRYIREREEPKNTAASVAKSKGQV